MKPQPIIIVAVGAGLLAAAAALLATPLVNVTQAEADAIQPGTTVSAAMTIIGGPPGWYDGIRSFGGGIPLDAESHRVTWVSNNGQITLDVDDDGRVAAVRFAHIVPLDRDVADMWLDRLTRGHREAALAAALALLTASAILWMWQRRVLVFGNTVVMLDDSTTRTGYCVGIGAWVVAICRKPVAARLS